MPVLPTQVYGKTGFSSCLPDSKSGLLRRSSYLLCKGVCENAPDRIIFCPYNIYIRPFLCSADINIRATITATVGRRFTSGVVTGRQTPLLRFCLYLLNQLPMLRVLLASAVALLLFQVSSFTFQISSFAFAFIFNILYILVNSPLFLLLLFLVSRFSQLPAFPCSLQLAAIAPI